MPKLSPDSVPIVEGKVVLFKRPRSPLWQARFRIRNKWVRVSTKTDDLDKAKDLATETWRDATYKEKNGLPVITRKFQSMAETVRDKFKHDYENNVGPTVNKDYYQAIDNWLIPFFGKMNIATIEHRHIKAFYEDRQAKFLKEHGKLPAAQTINTHSLALKFVFEEAVHREYMMAHHVPEAKLRGYAEKKNGKAKPRASFSIQEYRKIYRKMRYWIDKTKAGKFTDMRYLLRDAVLFLANSGIRYGTEFRSMRWNLIYIEKSGETGKSRVMILVDGKVGPRRAYVRHGALRYLERVWGRTEHLKDLSWDELMTKDEPVWQLPDGTVTKALDKSFTRMLKDLQMLQDSFGKNRSLYSLRHFYITLLLFRNRVPSIAVADQCGTSVKMIEDHYYHGEHDHYADLLSGHFD